MSKLSVSEIRAVAESAINARHAASTAKTAHEAKPDDQTLKAAYDAAEQTAKEAEAKADALSQESTKSPEQIAKIRRRHAILTQKLREAGELTDDDDEDDEALGDDPTRPVTFGDLQRIEARKATQTAVEMADAITDSAAKDAVKAALKRVVPSGDFSKDFTDAVAIANREKNNKILEEISRRGVPQQHRSGPGAPARSEGQAFEATAEEARYMKPPFNLTKEQIIAARPKE